MAVNLSPVGGVAAQFFSNNGVPLAGGKLYTYLAGTTTPAATYTSSNGSTAWTNPIVLNAGGRVPGSGEIWLTDGLLYKFLLKDANDVLIATYDDISGINSNFVAFVNQQEIVTATAGQTVFNLGISYQLATNSLSVFVDGVNQYGPGAQYSYVETDSNTVTFNSGLHVGAEVKFTTTQQQAAGAVDASQVSYDPPFTGSVATNVEAKLAQTVSVKDFGVVGDGLTDDTNAIQTAFDTISTAGGGEIIFDGDNDYLVSDTVNVKSNLVLRFIGKGFIKLTQSSTIGSILSFIGTSANPIENVVVYNPRVDGNDLGYPNGDPYGENGIAGSKCKNIRIYGGLVKNCRRGNSSQIGTGGKAVQFEDGVDDIRVDGVTAEDCTIAMETGGVPDVVGPPFDFRRATGVYYTNMKAIRCERLISFQQTLSPPDNSVSVASAVVDGVMAINCGREIPAGTELDFGLIVNDRAANCTAKNIYVFNDATYGKINAVVKQHRGANCEFDVTFYGNCDNIVSHDQLPSGGTTGQCVDNLFTVKQIGTTAYAVNGPSDVNVLDNLYSVVTDTVSSGLIGANVAVSTLYGYFVDGTKGHTIEGPFNAIAVYFGNTFATQPTAFAGEVAINGLVFTLTTGAHKIDSVDDLLLTANGVSRAKFNSDGAMLFGIPTYADNAAALTGGLTAGQLYKTATGTLQIVY